MILLNVNHLMTPPPLPNLAKVLLGYRVLLSTPVYIDIEGDDNEAEMPSSYEEAKS